MPGVPGVPLYKNGTPLNFIGTNKPYYPVK